MEMALYPHNQQAYDRAKGLLEEYGKAAIIHPTGTGKSFIGFALCSENPESRICWLSPSEYIFRTQLENWKEAGGKEMKNITFLTYARLMQMEQEEIGKLQPDYIILDEFHRCGARVWGQGVGSLLDANPQSKVLGLSATNIRYLDNQRDMAEELFHGFVASQMTLGEAIVKGILRQPKYVLSVYSYKKELEYYENRINTCRNKAVRDKARRYVQRLRRTIENSEGLEIVFKKHITQKNGKYIAFCSRKEHADEMIKQVPEWFGAIDRKPHVYCVYSGDPYAGREFTGFLEDDSSHLKLLFCIDMLNEGIHVPDIDGIILFRPTVSPTVFKQQIGRGMSAGSRKETVIIDVVNNIGNLYSVGAIEEEMAEAVELLKRSGNETLVVSDKFTIIDEVQECRKLFEELEQTLQVSWELMYAEAVKYYESFGDLNVPSSYVCPEGYRLGMWLVSQRSIYNGRRMGTLTPEQTELLNAIGMNWHYEKEKAWEDMFVHAERYYKEHGNLDIPANYVTENGELLGIWYRQNRNNYQNGSLSRERQIRLESIGIVWESVMDRVWKQHYEAAHTYQKKYGDLNIHADYISPEGFRLGSWISAQRSGYSKGKLSEERTALLEQIGMEWNRDQARWEKGYSYLKAYEHVNHSILVPPTYVTPDGFRLGRWVYTQKLRYRSNKLAQWKIDRLQEMDFVFHN